MSGEREQEARALLARDGAVVLVVAAARVLGSRLRELYPHRVRTSQDAGPVHLHADSFDLVVDVGGVPSRRRHPDEDHVLIQYVRPARSGGDSFALDAYGFVDGLASTDPPSWTSSPAPTSTCTASGRDCADFPPPHASPGTSSTPAPAAASSAAPTGPSPCTVIRTPTGCAPC
ncbi:hypothetical protein [Streptomyces edwardsiae]|uniref:Uncharacterized protein n=1 Tax=Streptomyces edwardsiae TaxID=3075527 RepID=A0ABU2QB32_9ACTN|nr:hypothetical protein [Streptomyces sp. DSM 41635]MDT0401163.1 hypothetical protein [Streptomyces sp. DSM 41635]